VDPFGRLSFARRRGSYNSTDFDGLLGIFPLTSGDVLLFDNAAFHHSRCVRAFANATV